MGGVAWSSQVMCARCGRTCTVSCLGLWPPWPRVLLVPPAAGYGCCSAKVFVACVSPARLAALCKVQGWDSLSLSSSSQTRKGPDSQHASVHWLYVCVSDATYERPELEEKPCL